MPYDWSTCYKQHIEHAHCHIMYFGDEKTLTLQLQDKNDCGKVSTM